MAWRTHLTDNVIHRLDILHGTPNVLCVWGSPLRPTFFDLSVGAVLGHLQLAPPSADRSSPEWALFLAGLCAPNGKPLPYVRLSKLILRSTQDGMLRVYDDGHGLTSVLDGNAQGLGSANNSYVSVGVAALTGVIAALDERGRLTLYKGQQPIGTFEIGLQPENGVLPELVISGDGEAIFATDGIRIVCVDARGQVLHSKQMHYFVSRIACSPDGALCATTDSDTSIIRVYRGNTLTFSHQKFAIDLYAAAPPMQLLEALATPRLGVSALAIDNGGNLAFSIEGFVTVSHLNSMDNLTRLSGVG